MDKRCQFCQQIIFKFLMEKSMVHELNSLTYSTVFTARPSFISTHITDPDVNELRRSRISNLPGYKKEDLSAKVNFVVVFQGMEIERLSREIEMLRVKAKDWQRQLHNYQSYEVQIRELTQRCHMYELQKEGMQNQHQKMKIFCQQLYRQFQEYKAKYGQADLGLKEKYGLEKKRSQQLQSQIQKWRHRFTSLQRSKSKELDEMRLQFQAQRKSMINREIKEITIRYENELMNVTAELRKAREEGEFKVSEIHRLGHLIQGYELREQEMGDVEGKMEEYQNKFVMLSQENYRLNQLLRWKGEQIQKLKASQQQARSQLDGSKLFQVENHKLSGEIERLMREVQEYKVVSSRAEQKMERLELENRKLGEYQKLADKSGAQIQRLNGIIHTKMHQVDQYKNNLSVLETKVSSMSQISQKEVASYQEKIVSFGMERDKMQNQLKSRLMDNQNLKGRLAEMERKVDRAEQVVRQNRELKGQLNKSVQQMEEFKMKISLLEDNVSIMSSLEQTLNRDQAIKAQLIAQRQRLNQTIRNLTLQLETANSKLSTLEGECNKYTNIQVEIREYQGRLASMTQQLDKINAQIHMRVGQLHQLRQNLKSLTNSKNIYQSIEQKLVENMAQMEKLILELDESRRDNQRLQGANMNLEMSVKKMQGDIIGINEERNQLNQVIQDKTLEVHRLGSQLDSFATVAAEHRMYQQQNQEFKTKIESMKDSYVQLEGRYQREAKKAEQYSLQAEQLCTQMMELRQQPAVSAKLGEQISSMRMECQQKNMAIGVLTKRIQTIEGILKSVKQRYAMQCHVAEQMRRKFESVNGKLVIFDQVVSMANRYAEQLGKVSEQNIVLESQTRIMDIQMCQSVKMLENKEQSQQKTQHLLNTFGFPQVTYKNQSIANQISNKEQNFQAKQGHAFTFKQMQSESIEPNFNRPPSSVQQRQCYQFQRDEPQISSLAEARQVKSVRHSIINNLIMDRDSGRYQNVGVAQYQSINNPNFGQGITVSKMRYVSGNSPQNISRPATTIVSPSPSPSNARNNEVRYVAIDSTIQNQGYSNQGYVNPFQEQRENHSTLLENAGVKRVTSYTTFSNQPGHGHVQYQQTSLTPVASHGHSQHGFQAQDVPRIRVLQAAQSPNIANSTRSTSVHQTKQLRGNEIPRWSNLQPRK